MGRRKVGISQTRLGMVPAGEDTGRAVHCAAMCYQDRTKKKREMEVWPSAGPVDVCYRRTAVPSPLVCISSCPFPMLYWYYFAGIWYVLSYRGYACIGESTSCVSWSRDTAVVPCTGRYNFVCNYLCTRTVCYFPAPVSSSMLYDFFRTQRS